MSKSKGSRKKKKNNNKKEEEISKTLDEVLENINYEDGASLNDLYERHGLSRIPLRASDNPDIDIPPCDYCGKQWSGKHQCSQCELAFYCSRECQKIAWKQGGHKQKCATMAETCEETSKHIVECLANSNMSATRRFDCLNDLAGTGIYKAARRHGLDAAIQQLFREDNDQVLERYRKGVCLSYTQWIICVLFRNGRCEGHNVGNGAFSHIDGYRCKSFVKSHPQAFYDWFQASITVITAFLDKEIARNDYIRVTVLRNARDVVAGWSMVFANDKVAKAIVLGQSRQVDEVAYERALWIAKIFKPTLARFWSAPNGFDVGQSVEGQLNQLAAMILLRLEQFQVCKDRIKYLKSLGIKDPVKKSMFLKIAVPMADHYIRKGRSPDNDEAKVIVRGQRIEY